jgi:hypothetical protein
MCSTNVKMVHTWPQPILNIEYFYTQWKPKLSKKEKEKRKKKGGDDEEFSNSRIRELREISIKNVHTNRNYGSQT